MLGLKANVIKHYLLVLQWAAILSGIWPVAMWHQAPYRNPKARVGCRLLLEICYDNNTFKHIRLIVYLNNYHQFSVFRFLLLTVFFYYSCVSL